MAEQRILNRDQLRVLSDNLESYGEQLCKGSSMAKDVVAIIRDKKHDGARSLMPDEIEEMLNVIPEAVENLHDFINVNEFKTQPCLTKDRFWDLAQQAWEDAVSTRKAANPDATTGDQILANNFLDHAYLGYEHGLESIWQCCANLNCGRDEGRG